MRTVREKFVESLRRDIPAFVVVDGHTIFLDPSDRLELSIRRYYEPFETEILKKLIVSGNTVVDVGAHIGYHVLTVARLVGNKGTVFAFEPDPDNFPILEKNISANTYTNVVAVRKAVSDLTETKVFYFSKDRLGSLNKDQMGTGGSYTKVDSVSLDDFMSSARVDFIKIDVDGGEEGLIRGMHNILKRDSLAILMENNLWIAGAADPSESFKLFRSNGFKIYSLHDIKNEMVEIFDAGSTTGRNFLCIKGKDLKPLKKFIR